MTTVYTRHVCVCQTEFNPCEAHPTVKRVLVAPATTPAANFGFDVTPARLVTGLISERGVCGASEKRKRGQFFHIDI